MFLIIRLVSAKLSTKSFPVRSKRSTRRCNIWSWAFKVVSKCSSKFILSKFNSGRKGMKNIPSSRYLSVEKFHNLRQKFPKTQICMQDLAF